MVLIPKIEKCDYSKHLPQTSADKTSDLFFILSALYVAEKQDKSLTHLTLEKSLFKTTVDMANEGKSFLNTFFYVNTLGPHNSIFYKYLEELESGNLLEKEGNKVFLTAKGVSVISGLVEKISSDQELLSVLVSLQDAVKKYADNPGLSVNELHAMKVIDSTDKSKQKTIKEIVEEIKPEEAFEKSSQFKYINPLAGLKIEKVNLPIEVLNNLENVIAEVDTADLELSAPLEVIFSST